MRHSSVSIPTMWPIKARHEKRKRKKKKKMKKEKKRKEIEEK